MLLFSRKSRGDLGSSSKRPASSSAATVSSLQQQQQQQQRDLEAHQQQMGDTFDAVVHPNPHTSSTLSWLSSLRKRTMSVASGGGGNNTTSRKYSANSNASITSLNTSKQLMRAHKMQTKTGEPVELYFGHDAMSINGRAIAYGELVLWSHTASHFTMTYLVKSTGKRKDVVLVPLNSSSNSPKPSEVTDMISLRIAKLVAEQTGCSEERAIRLATQRANEHDVRLANEHMDRLQQQSVAASASEDRIKSQSRNARAGSGIIELSTSSSVKPKAISIDQQLEDA